MRYISLFSGVEAASVAWIPLGWEPVCFCEVDEFPSAVLACRFPNVPNLGDVTKVDWSEVYARFGAIDVLVGGSPCQSFSIAGNREGLAGESGLMFEYIRAIRELLQASGGGVRATSSGRTFRGRLVPSGELHSGSYSRSWMNSGTVWHGAYSMRSLSEYPTGRLMDSSGRLRNAAGASSLSEFLEARTPQKYSLSAKACAGIIRRAEKRGKPLPEMLRKALESVIEQSR